MKKLNSKICGIIIMGALMSAVLYPFAVDAAKKKSDYNKEYLSMTSVQEMYLTYNGRINSLFNDAIKMTLSDEGIVEIYKNDRKQKEACNNPKNIASACIFRKALFEYRGYKEAMQSAKKKTDAVPLFKDATAPETPSAASLAAGTKTSFINAEIGEGENGRAMEALDQTLAFYDEFGTSYQMHLDNQRIIKALEKFNKRLSEVRTESYELPGKFHDATSDGAGCT
ncbi:hypothetical protein HOG48_04125 [Candidatus Peregrinibacteria bacterium]|nr:hypothetical protein [Candidatus Peregrinibacteria bacterium]